MSKKPYDFLVTEKEPLLYVEKTIVRMDDGFLTFLRGEAGKEVVAPASHLVMMLGAGTSITQEAAIFCATNDLHVSFARGGSNIHSFFMSGRYQSPESLLNQAAMVSTYKFRVAQYLMEYRLRRLKQPEAIVDSMKAYGDIVGLVAWEGRWAQTSYRKFALANKVAFSRNFDSRDAVNSKLNVLNNALYSICTAICLSCGLHPSLGFVHGLTRRGGFAFDLADIFKTELCLPLAFDPKVSGAKASMHLLGNKLRSNNSEALKTMVQLCLWVGGANLMELERFCAGNSN